MIFLTLVVFLSLTCLTLQRNASASCLILCYIFILSYISMISDSSLMQKKIEKKSYSWSLLAILVKYQRSILFLTRRQKVASLMLISSCSVQVFKWCCRAMERLDNQTFQGRLLRILPAKHREKQVSVAQFYVSVFNLEIYIFVDYIIFITCLSQQ